jgi:hypothetical protein
MRILNLLFHFILASQLFLSCIITSSANALPLDPASECLAPISQTYWGYNRNSDEKQLDKQIKEALRKRNRTEDFESEAEKLRTWILEENRLEKLVITSLSDTNRANFPHLAEEMRRIVTNPEFKMYFLEPMRKHMAFTILKKDGTPLETRVHFEKDPPSIYFSSRIFETSSQGDKMGLFLHALVSLALGPGNVEHSIGKTMEKNGAILYDQIENAEIFSKVKGGMYGYYLLKQNIIDLSDLEVEDFKEQYLEIRSSIVKQMQDQSQYTHSLSLHTVELIFKTLKELEPREIDEIHFKFGLSEFLNLTTPDFRKDPKIKDFIHKVMLEVASAMPPEILEEYIEA